MAKRAPSAARPGYDFLIRAMGGLMSITGVPDDEAGAGPQKVGVALTDILTGLYATIGILAALQERNRSGLGQHIDTALSTYRSQRLRIRPPTIWSVAWARCMGNAHPSIVPYQTFPTAERDSRRRQRWPVRPLLPRGRPPEWAQDERFATNPQRVRHRAELISLLRQTTVMRTTAEWVSALEQGRCALWPGSDQVFADPQVQARGIRVDLPHPLGTVDRGQPGASERHAGAVPPPTAAGGAAHGGGVARLAAGRSDGSSSAGMTATHIGMEARHRQR